MARKGGLQTGSACQNKKFTARLASCLTPITSLEVFRCISFYGTALRIRRTLRYRRAGSKELIRSMHVLGLVLALTLPAYIFQLFGVTFLPRKRLL